jgi:hypothetical protein
MPSFSLILIGRLLVGYWNQFVSAPKFTLSFFHVILNLKSISASIREKFKAQIKEN